MAATKALPIEDFRGDPPGVRWPRLRPESVYFNTPVPRRYYGATATGGTDDRVWKRLMREWYGLTPCRGDAWETWARCPHHVGSGRCPRNCREWESSHRPLWDHARAWRDLDGNVVITLEPWGDPFHEAEAYARLTAELDAHGIRVGFEGRSPYGASYLLALKRRRAPA